MCDSGIRQLDSNGVQVPYQHIVRSDSMISKLVEMQKLQTSYQLRENNHVYHNLSLTDFSHIKALYMHVHACTFTL